MQYESQKKIIEKFVLKEAKYLSLNYDLWNDSSKNWFMGLTFHFIDSSWNLHTPTAEVIPIKDAHTGQNFSKEIYKSFCDWNLNLSNIVSGVADNEAAAQKGLKDLQDLLPLKYTKKACSCHSL